jgi:hypothetical protein
MVGRSPERSRESAARSTSPAVTPREAGPKRRGGVVTSDMYEIIQDMDTVEITIYDS